MRDLQLVPANRRVRVDLRTYPAIAGFIAQTRQAEGLPYLPQVEELLAQGDDALLRVLEGVIEPNVAAQTLTNRINEQFGLASAQPLTACDLSGDLELWHSLVGEPADYLTDFVSSLNLRCLGLDMTIEFVPGNALVDTYIEAFANNEAPDLLLTSSSSLQRLIAANAILSVDQDMMQSFSTTSQATVSLLGIPYGIPNSLNGNVFYYNNDIISDAPITIDGLLVTGSPSFSLSRSIENMLWTVSAFNGIAISDGAVIVDFENLRNWLNWLSQEDDTDHIEIVPNNFLRRNRFVQGESAYYIASNLELGALSEELGGALGVALFPTGTGSFASPLVTSLSLFINPNSDQTDVALAFANELTDVGEQETMIERLRWIPASVIADQNMIMSPEIATIDQIMQMGIVINDNPDLILAELSRAIDTVLRGERTTDAITQALFDRLQEIRVVE